MEIYSETGKTKTNELRVTRPIGALLVAMDQPFANLTNETITAYIERANGNNTEILTDYPLAKFIAASVAGTSAVFEDDNGLTALCELSEEGSVNLQETESIRIKLDGLKSAVTYSLNGLEYPTLSNSVSKFSRKNILAGETERRFDVAEQEVMIIDGVDAILEMNVTFSNGHTCKFTPAEIKAISRDVDAVKLMKVGLNTTTLFDLPYALVFPLSEVQSIDVKKTGVDPIGIYLKNDVETF